YVLGNHEYYRSAIPNLTEKIRRRCEGTNIRLLENQETQIEGVRFLGCTLWTDFRLFGPEMSQRAMEEARAKMNDFKLIRHSPKYGRFSPNTCASFHRRSRAWLVDKLKEPGAPTIVVTHHAPHLNCVQESFRSQILSAAYASDLSDIIEASN